MTPKALPIDYLAVQASLSQSGLPSQASQPSLAWGRDLEGEGAKYHAQARRPSSSKSMPILIGAPWSAAIAKDF